MHELSTFNNINVTSYHRILPVIFSLNIAHSISSPEHSNNYYHETEEYFDDYLPQPAEQTGSFKTWYRWKQIDFLFPSESYKKSAIATGAFIQENVLPLGIETYKDRLFVTFPKWKTGIPFTLGVLPKLPREESPKVIPYPSWDFHLKGSCDGLTSVFRIQSDKCSRLWVLDSGQIDISQGAKQVCPPSLFIFDLFSDRLIHRYQLPQEFVKQDSLYSNLIIDVRNQDCDNAFAYVTDVWRFGLLVYSLKENKSWRITNHLFFPDPFAAAFNIHGIDFEWTDGIFSLAMSPEDPFTSERYLFFHPMASFREFYVPTSIIQNETEWMNNKNSFKLIGQSRGIRGHAAGAGMDDRGVLFYNLLSKDGVGCWNSNKPYTKSNVVSLIQNSETMFFPNDIKVDKEERTSIWIMTNRLPAYLYRQLDKNDYNFRIISAFVDDATKDTACEITVKKNVL